MAKESYNKCPVGTEVETLIFDKANFTKMKAEKWLMDHDYNNNVDIDEKEKTYHFRQQDSSNFLKDSFRTIEFGHGIKAVIGCPLSGMSNPISLEKVKEIYEWRDKPNSISGKQNIINEIHRKFDISIELSSKIFEKILEGKSATETHNEIEEEYHGKKFIDENINLKAFEEALTDEPKKEKNSKLEKFEKYKNQIEEYFNGEAIQYKGDNFELNVIEIDIIGNPNIKLHRKFLSMVFLEKLNKVLNSLETKLTYIIDSSSDLTIF